MLIRCERSRLVVLGTVIRLSTNAGALGIGLWFGGLPGVVVGTVGIAAGLLSILVVRTPDILIDGAGRLLAVRTASAASA